MSHLLSRSLLIATSVSALCFACGSESKPTNTADNVPPAESPAGTTSAPGDATMTPPNGEPTATPPSTPQSRSDATSDNRVGMPNSSAQSAATPQLTQSQIAMIADLANNSEIEQAKLAQTKARAASVKKFAAMMVKHHTDAKNEQAKLFKQLNLTPTQSQTATTLKDGADRTLGSLRGADGQAFDVAYIDSQVDAHQKVLDTLNNELLPSATDQELVSGLNKMKATVEAHLTEAKAIQAELAKTSTSASSTR
jgi:putative membrane protein